MRLAPHAVNHAAYCRATGCTYKLVHVVNAKSLLPSAGWAKVLTLLYFLMRSGLLGGRDD